MGNHRVTGRRREEQAAAFLKRNGYEILEQNYRDRYGELDLVAREDDTLVFVEVKYRKDTAMGYPEEAVGAGKQRQIRRMAAHYLYRKGLPEDVSCRFDVVAILGEEIRLIRDAF